MSVPLSTAFAHGIAADRPAASATIEGQFYFSEDTGDFAQVQDGVWVTVAASGGGSGVQVTEVEISSTELLDLHNTPKVLVAAPGAGKVIVPQSVSIVTHEGSISYGGEGGGNMFGLRIGAEGIVGIPCSQAFYGGPDTSQFWSQTGFSALYDVLTGFANLPLRLTLDSALTDGNGTAAITVAYLVI